MNGGKSEKRWVWRRGWIMAGIVVVASGLSLVWLGWSERGELLGWLDAGRTSLLGWLRSVPVPFYLLAFAVLPALGAPLTVFYLTIGAVVGSLWLSVALAWLCVFANLLLTYAVARSFLHPVVERLVRRKGFKIPAVAPADEWKLIVLLRFSPIPWVFQCYLLGLGGVRLVPYLFLSFLIQAAVGSGMIIVGESLFSGRARYALLGIFLFLAVSFGFSVIRRRTQPTNRHELPVA